MTPGLIKTNEPIVMSGPGSQLTFAGDLSLKRGDRLRLSGDTAAQ